MATFSRREALTSVVVAIGLLVTSTASGAAATVPPQAAVTFGSPPAAGVVPQPCASGEESCASSDPGVTLTWSGAATTTGCRFRLVLDWGDGGPEQTVEFSGAAAGSVWPVTHTYSSRVSARHSYQITSQATVLADPQALGCSIDSAATTFTLLCTDRQLSGPAWSDRWPGGDRDVHHLNDEFRGRVEPFLAAMARAGITVQPQSTLRSPQRSYLMHFSYLVGKGLLGPQDVPAYARAAGEKAPQVCWVHRDATGNTDDSASVTAAQNLLKALGVDSSLRTPPALRSRHNTGDAIDMKIQWSTRSIKIKDAAGRTVRIASKPRDGTNPDLIAVGASYGVHHFSPATTDRNHWSVDGH